MRTRDRLRMTMTNESPIDLDAHAANIAAAVEQAKNKPEPVETDWVPGAPPPDMVAEQMEKARAASRRQRSSS